MQFEYTGEPKNFYFSHNFIRAIRILRYIVPSAPVSVSNKKCIPLPPSFPITSKHCLDIKVFLINPHFLSWQGWQLKNQFCISS